MTAHEQWLAAAQDPQTQIRWHDRQAGFQQRRDTYHVDTRQLPCHVMILVSSGTLPGHIAHKDVTVTAGQLLWLPPQIVNGFTWDTSLRFYNCWFALDPEPDLALPALLVDQVDAARSVIEAIASELAMPGPLHEVLLRSLVLQLCCLAIRGNRLLGSGATLSIAQRLKLEAYLSTRHHLRPSPGELAQVLDLGADWFARIFRRTYGIAPRQWIVHARMQAAAEALRQGERSVATVAAEFGYDSAALFHRQFKQVHGSGPQAWRSRVLKKNRP